MHSIFSLTLLVLKKSIPISKQKIRKNLIDKNIKQGMWFYQNYGHIMENVLFVLQSSFLVAAPVLQ